MPTHTIISFLGETDLRFSPVGDCGSFDCGRDMSPVLRLLVNYPYHPFIPSETRLVLFDDHPDDNKRKRYVEALKLVLPEIGLEGLQVELLPINLSSPTDLDDLYREIWPVVQQEARRRKNELVIHYSSGTASMQFTLTLAAYCTRKGVKHLFETSVDGVREITLPYVLAAREARGGEAHSRLSSLSKEARKTLLPDTVVKDRLVHAAYAALYKAATGKMGAACIKIMGPTGSGKWHAAKQFAVWRGKPEIHAVSEMEEVLSIPEEATLLVKHLDRWSEEGLRKLTNLSETRNDIAILATFRSDREPLVSQQVLVEAGFPDAAQIEMPALGVRDDVVDLGEALARQLGMTDGKLRERMATEWVADTYPNGLHDLKSLLATTGLQSPGKHPELSAFNRINKLREGNDLLDRAWQQVSKMANGNSDLSLKELQDWIEYALVLTLRNRVENQKQVQEKLDISQSKVSTVLKNKPDVIDRNPHD